jgi:hypothetical protein
MGAMGAQQGRQHHAKVACPAANRTTAARSPKPLQTQLPPRASRRLRILLLHRPLGLGMSAGVSGRDRMRCIGSEGLFALSSALRDENSTPAHRLPIPPAAESFSTHAKANSALPSSPHSRTRDATPTLQRTISAAPFRNGALVQSRRCRLDGARLARPSGLHAKAARTHGESSFTTTGQGGWRFRGLSEEEVRTDISPDTRHSFRGIQRLIQCRGSATTGGTTKKVNSTTDKSTPNEDMWENPIDGMVPQRSRGAPLTVS